LGGGGRLLVVVLGGLDGAQRVVPVGLERVGNEPIVGVDGEVAAARELGALARAVDLRAAQLVGFVGALLEFGLDGERDVEREWGDGRPPLGETGLRDEDPERDTQRNHACADGQRVGQSRPRIAAAAGDRDSRTHDGNDGSEQAEMWWQVCRPERQSSQ
jgi:hypothetical protein